MQSNNEEKKCYCCCHKAGTGEGCSHIFGHLAKCSHCQPQNEAKEPAIQVYTLKNKCPICASALYTYWHTPASDHPECGMWYIDCTMEGCSLSKLDNAAINSCYSFEELEADGYIILPPFHDNP